MNATNINKKKQRDKKLIHFKSYQHKWEFNIIIFMFLLIFIYLLGITVTYLNEHQISTYEVRYGSIIKDTAYTGLALREETVFNSPESGYIQFYYQSGSRISVNNSIYTISNTALDISDVTSSTADNYVLNSVDQQKVLTAIQSFNSNYSATSYSSTYDLIDEIESIVMNSENQEIINSLSEMDSTTSGLSIYKADVSGILLYTIDSYETMTSDTFTASAFDRSTYASTTINSGDSINNNAPIYKIIENEDWCIIIDVAEDELEIFQEISNVTFKFLYDNEEKSAAFSLIEKDNNTYGLIELSTDMIRYSSERFLDIELILDTLEGYKIPISSVISREFYQIPLAYITQGGESGSEGVLSTTGVEETFKETKIYYKDDEYAYISLDSLNNNELLIYVESETDETAEITEEPIEIASTYRVSTTADLTGVYRVNKGYAEFKIVEILTESTEYYIVNDSTSYSISNYDRIALYGDSVSDNTIIN
ncbi:MAG: HlyD family efflux transporter periplasmic adaptor subunit [Eubacteriales bacterium]